MANEKAASASVRTSDMRFSYTRYGNGGRAALLLHGWPQTGMAWRRVAPLLGPDFDVIVPDLPGFGNSSKPLSGFDKKTISRRVRELVHTLGIETIAVVGHDIGGTVAYAYAAQWPDEVSHLVFIESSLPAFGQEQAMNVAEGGSWHFGFNMAGDIAEELVRGRERVFIEYLMRRERVGLFDATAVSEPEIAYYANAMAQPGALRCSMAYYQALPTDRADNQILGQDPLPMPVLAVGGEWGYGQGSADSIRQVAPQTHDVIIARSGHYVPEEQPVQLAKLIADFIRG